MSGSRQRAGVVAEAEFDVAEELSVGGIDERLGHLAEGLVGGGSQLVPEGAEARFTVCGGR